MLSVPADLCCLVWIHTLAVSCVQGGGGVCYVLRFSIWHHYICDFRQ